MSEKVTAYKVFIASPGGLETEREAFRATLANHSEADAFHRGCIFWPIGWEKTLGGEGRPQERINDEVRECDYFVLVLWDRWGSPTDKPDKAKYSSGSEEEFRVAMACLENPERPMRQTLVLFKSVDERQVSDPGEQLQKVLDFKRELEEENSLLFRNFDDINSFNEILRRHLAKWVRDHEGGDGQKISRAPVKPPQPLVGVEGGEPPAPAATEAVALTDKANELEKQGRMTEAETELARAAADDDLGAMFAYGRFLWRTGRARESSRIYYKILESPNAKNDGEVQAAAYNNLGLNHLESAEYPRALEMYARALEILRMTRGNPGQTTLVNVGTVLLMQARYEEAERVYKQAAAFGPPPPEMTPSDLIAQAGLAALYKRLGRFSEAEMACEEAIAGLEARGTWPDQLAFAHKIRGDIYFDQGQFSDALGLYRRARQTFSRALGETNPRLAPILNGIGRALYRLGEPKEASTVFNEARLLEEDQLPLEHPDVAETLHGLAWLVVAESFDRAEAFLIRSLDINIKLFTRTHPNVGKALVALGQLYSRGGEISEARELYQEGIQLLKQFAPAHPETEAASEELAKISPSD